MAKSTKDRDRRAVVEQMRRDQQRAERRRTIAVISACVVVGLVIIGLAAIPLIRQNQVESGALASIGSSKSAAGCQKLVEKEATGNQEHRPEGTVIDYPDSPPAFGPHYPTPAPFARKFYTADDRPKLENLVHNLEHGYTLLWYDETIADDDQAMADLRAIASKFTDDSNLRNKSKIVPWTADDGAPFPDGQHLAFTHWSIGGDGDASGDQTGITQFCSEPSGAAVEQFIQDYPYTDSPEPGVM
jgi:hypothetical protein